MISSSPSFRTVCATIKSKFPPGHPSVCQRTSSPAARSCSITAKASPNTSMASSNRTLCLRRLLAAFASSHSNRTIPPIVYPQKCNYNNGGFVVLNSWVPQMERPTRRPEHTGLAMPTCCRPVSAMWDVAPGGIYPDPVGSPALFPSAVGASHVNAARKGWAARTPLPSTVGATQVFGFQFTPNCASRGRQSVNTCAAHHTVISNAAARRFFISRSPLRTRRAARRESLHHRSRSW